MFKKTHQILVNNKLDPSVNKKNKQIDSKKSDNNFKHSR